jgi:energy-coupling factor transporter transmembrane protein EcfT
MYLSSLLNGTQYYHFGTWKPFWDVEKLILGRGNHFGIILKPFWYCLFLYCFFLSFFISLFLSFFLSSFLSFLLLLFIYLLFSFFHFRKATDRCNERAPHRVRDGQFTSLMIFHLGNSRDRKCNIGVASISDFIWISTERCHKRK